MAESIVQVSEGVGKKLHTWQRTVGANNVDDEFVIPGEYPLPGYCFGGTASVATSADHLFQLMAGASLKVRLRYFRIEQSANATAASIIALTLFRLTTAGTGGTALTPRPFDTADAAAGATAMTLPTAKGTEGVDLGPRTVLALRQTVATAGAQVDDVWEWYQKPGMPPIIIPAGTANGLAVKIGTGVAGASCAFYAEFVETAF
jgi:hypothetical protein